MLVDLHAHYPMHVIPPDQPEQLERPGALERMVDWKGARFRARLLNLISKHANYEGNKPEEASVTTDGMASGDVGIALSVLYWPFDEFRFGYKAPPEKPFVEIILEQAGWVEAELGTHPGWKVIKDAATLEQAAAGNIRGLVHCTEGGFGLGSSVAEVRASVNQLADIGIAYITLAHLFWKHIATNAPALPFMPDWVYRRIFRQPAVGLSPEGQAAAKEMVKRKVLIDVSHMSERSFDDVMEIAREGSGTPVMATHSAARLDSNPLGYNLSRSQVEAIAARDGVVGLIMCTHYIGPRHKWEPADQKESLAALKTHIDQIAEWTGKQGEPCYDHIGFGTDLDGFIKPALKDLADMEKMADLQKFLRDEYGPENAEKISSGNALRMLRYRFGG
jgi:microsomal dipeptidase-like Zn-dependent dipeptidase